MKLNIEVYTASGPYPNDDSKYKCYHYVAKCTTMDLTAKGMSIEEAATALKIKMADKIYLAMQEAEGRILNG